MTSPKLKLYCKKCPRLIILWMKFNFVEKFEITQLPLKVNDCLKPSFVKIVEPKFLSKRILVWDWASLSEYLMIH